MIYTRGQPSLFSSCSVVPPALFLLRRARAQALVEVVVNMLQLGVCAIYFSFVSENIAALIGPAAEEHGWNPLWASRAACFG